MLACCRHWMLGRCQREQDVVLQFAASGEIDSQYYDVTRIWLRCV